MNFFRRHKKAWTVIVIVSSIALIIASFAPLIFLQ